MDEVGEYTLTVMRKAEWYNNWLLSLFKDELGKEILEIGMGIGNFTRILKKFGNVSAIDINREYIRKYNIKDVKYGFGDIEKGEYFFKNRKFDTVVCLNVLEHIKNDTLALKNIRSLLNKDGKLILLIPAHQAIFGHYDKLLGHYRRYNLRETFRKLKNHGFYVSRIRYINWWAAIGWYIFIKLLGTTDFPDREVGIFDRFGKLMLWPEKYIKIPFGLSVLAIAEKQGD